MPDQAHHVSMFSSDMLPERERFDNFLEEFARKFFRLDIQRLGDAKFHAHLRATSLGSVFCKSVDYSPSSFGRTRDLINDGNDDFMFHICRASPFHDSLRDKMVEVGEGVLVSNATASFVANNAAGRCLSVAIPSKTLLRLVPGSEDLARTAIASDSMEMRLLRSYVVTLLEGPPASAAMLQAASNHVLDLVALALGAKGDVAHVAGRRGLRQARLEAVRRSILARLHEPGLSPRDIARENAISERYVRKLFEHLGTSFSDFLLEQRLDLAHRLLSNPLHRGRKISDIASDAGFGDLSHFNRNFRRRFGDTPSGVRERFEKIER